MLSKHPFPAPLRAVTSRYWLGATVAAGFVASLAGIGIAWFFAQGINGVFLQHESLQRLAWTLSSFLACVLLRVVAACGQAYCAGHLAAQAKTALRQQTIATQALAPEALQAHGLTHWIRGIDSLDPWFAQYLPQVFLALIVPLTILCVVAIVDPWSGLVFAITAPLLPLFLSLIGITTQQKSAQQWKQLAQQGNLYLETLLGLRVLRQFGRSRDWGVQLAKGAESLRQATLTVLRLAFLSAFVLEIVATLGTAIIAVEVGLRLLHGLIGYREALFVLVLAPEFYLPLRQLGLKTHAAWEGKSVVQSIFPQLIDNVVCNTQVHKSRQFRTNSQAFMQAPTSSPPHLSTYISATASYSVSHLSARWSQTNSLVIHDVTFQHFPGELLALAGASGCGKSSLLACLTGELAPTQGQVFRPFLHRTLWIPQEPTFYHRSLRDNLWMRPNASSAQDDTLWKALSEVGLVDMIQQQSQGLDTLAGEGGVRFSGGERRRIALARALIHPHEVMLLDEPDAHLDADALALWDVHLLRMSSTRLVVSHRAQTLAKADRVLFMKQGTLAGLAPHAQLLAENADYRALLGETSR